MGFIDLLYYLLEHSKSKPAKKDNAGKLSDKEIMKYRQMLNDKSYMNKAVDKTAEIIMEGWKNGG